MGGNRSVFTFKQFSLAHGNPGLKISTEACILGAWAHKFAKGKILDIGTGCGLMACMLAQGNPEVSIDVIEIHQQVATLALENIKNSPFKNQIQVMNGDIRSLTTNNRYDFIISNPPFFSSLMYKFSMAISSLLVDPRQITRRSFAPGFEKIYRN